MRINRFVRRLLFVICTCCLTVLSQTETAVISGRVTDPSGAVIKEAGVSITNIDTNVVSTVSTNDRGIYIFPNIAPGRYRITVKSEGFQQITETGLIVHVQDNISRNYSLTVGSTSQTVTVVADQENINASDGSVSTVVDRQFAENMPMNGRSFQTLIQLTPGVVTIPSNFNDGGQFSVNGQRGESNYWTVDGVSANIGVGSGTQGGNGFGGALGSFSALGGTNSLVSVDALQEFRIQTSTYAPEFGRTPGGQISIVTRSGTNQFHGTAFDYLRNDVLDANDWFADTKGLPKPRERQNDFGGTLSGPILKDRAFFFFSYEGLRLRLPQVALTTVPDVAARQSAIPAMQPFLNAFPLPNGPEDSANAGVAQFNASYSNPATLDAYSLRIDHRLNDKLSLFARYNYSPSELDQRGEGAPLSTITRSRITTQTATVGGTWFFSSATTNDLRFNYSRVNASSVRLPARMVYYS
jgi:hypothetical protein